MIKSFEMDHTQLFAPKIRLADIYKRNNVVVRKYDLRFLTPRRANESKYTYLHSDIMHSMEHLLATSFKEVFGDDMIDLSPMGCHTGFYFTLFVDDSWAMNLDEVNEAIERKILQAIKKSPEVEIPEPTEKNCGEYTLHDIPNARRALILFSRMFEGDDYCPSYTTFNYLLYLLKKNNDSIDRYITDFHEVDYAEMQNIINDLQFLRED